MIDLNQYKNGNVSEEELEEFTNTFLRAKYDDDRKSRWQQMLVSEYKFQRDQNDPIVRRFNKRILLWIASAVAVVLVLIMFIFSPNNFVQNYGELADTYLLEDFYENREDNRGTQDIAQINLQAIFAYNQKDFEVAIGHYEMIIGREQANDEHHFFLGLSYLYVERYDAAILNLLKVRELNANSKFIKEYRWFLALAYLKNKQVNEGRAMLLSIRPDDWKYQKAQELLDAIGRS